jgi:pilus assembly protein CpaB
MRRQALFFLILALVLGGLAAVLALQVLRPGTATPDVAPGEISAVDVVVASRDLPSGSLVGADDVRTIRWPADAVPAGYSSSVSEVVGRGLLLTVRENEPMLSSKLARPEAGGGMSISIPEGKRALTFRVDDIIGVGGFVRPGHKVDVLVTVGADGGGGQPTTRMVLQNIAVAATGSTVEPNPQGEPETVPNVTFHLDPSQAERLVMAARNGSIQLALRNPLDADTIDTPGIRLNQLLAGVPTARAAAPAPAAARAAPAAPQPPSQVNVEIYRGPQRSTSQVDTSVVGGSGGGL